MPVVVILLVAFQVALATDSCSKSFFEVARRTYRELSPEDEKELLEIHARSIAGDPVEVVRRLNFLTDRISDWTRITTRPDLEQTAREVGSTKTLRFLKLAADATPGPSETSAPSPKDLDLEKQLLAAPQDQRASFWRFEHPDLARRYLDIALMGSEQIAIAPTSTPASVRTALSVLAERGLLFRAAIDEATLRRDYPTEIQRAELLASEFRNRQQTEASMNALLTRYDVTSVEARRIALRSARLDAPTSNQWHGLLTTLSPDTRVMLLAANTQGLSLSDTPAAMWMADTTRRQVLYAYSQSITGLKSLIDYAKGQGEPEKDLFAVFSDHIPTLKSQGGEDIIKELGSVRFSHEQSALIAAKWLENTPDLVDFALLDRHLQLTKNPVFSRMSFGILPRHFLKDADLDVDPEGDLKGALQLYQQRFPTVLSKATIDSVTQFDNQQLMLHALRIRYVESRLNPQILETQESTVEIFSRETGISMAALQKISPNRKRDIFLYALDIARVTGRGSLRFLEERSADLQSDEVFALLNTIRNTLQLRDQTVDPREELAGIIAKLPAQLNAVAMKQAVTDLESAMLARVNAMFAGQTKVQFSAEQINELIKTWGSLEVMASLLANYRQQGNHAQIPVFAKISEHILNNSFRDFKYHGDPRDDADVASAKAQLANMSPEQIEGWKTNVWSIKAGGGVTIDFLSQAMSQIKRIATTDLDAHIPEEGSRALSTADQAILLRVITEHKAAPAEKLKLILEQLGGEPVATFRGVMQFISQFAKTSDEIGTIRSYAEWMRGLANDINAAANVSNGQQIRNDFDAIARAATPPTVSGKRDSTLVFTVTVDDPMSLITVGDRVLGLKPCQNYKTGSHVRSLNGYVMDANVKAILGFDFVRGREFKNRDYDKLHLAASRGEITNAEWLAAEHKIRFTLADGSVIQNAQPVYYAQIRHIMKLGQTSKGVAINLEEAYIQPGGDSGGIASDILTSEALVVRAKQAQLAGAGTSQRIAISATRNLPGLEGQGGVYSDSAGGIKSAAYSMNEKLEK